MSLFINQGQHKEDEGVDFSPFELKDALLQIMKIELDGNQQGMLKITEKVLTEGNYRNRLIFDRVPYLPNDPFEWKYKALRSAAGVPYRKGEPDQIDIEGMLLNRAIKADLGVKDGTNKEGKTVKYQTITYKKAQVETQEPVEVNDGFDPFPPEPVQESMDFSKKAEPTQAVETPSVAPAQTESAPVANPNVDKKDELDW